MANSTISYLWRDQKAAKGFRSGVSLHSHTNQSKETLDFLANLGNQYPVIRPLLSRLERRSKAAHGVRINYAASYWTPPMTPKLAFDLESRQIEKLDVAPWFRSPTTTTSRRPMLLRTVPSARAHSGFGGVERALWRRAVVSSRHSQPAQRTGRRVDARAGGLHRQSQRCATDARFWRR